MELFDAVKEIKILEVAEALAIQITSHHGSYSVAICPFHEDHKGGGGKPNLNLLTNINRFKCQKCGEKGSVLDLWMKLTKNQDAASAAKAMAAQFHVQYDDDFLPKPKQAKPKNPYVAKEWDLDVVEQAHKNLMSEASKEHLEHLKKIRNLTDEYIVQKKIGLMEVWGIDAGNCADLAYTIPILDAAGTTLYGVRTHSRIVRKNKKCIGSKYIKGGGQYQNLYDLRSYKPDGAELHVVEGEGDLWTAECLLKLNAITAPLGAVNIPTILAQNINALGDLTKKEKIVLYPDNDFSGLRCMARIRTRMPKEAKVYMVHWPDTYAEKEDLSYWFLTLGKTHAELETLIKVYTFEEAEAWLKKHMDMVTAAKNQAIRITEFGNCYFKKVPKAGKKKVGIAIDGEDPQEVNIEVDGKVAEAGIPISEVEETVELLKSLPKDPDLHEAIEEQGEEFELVRISSFAIHGKAILDIDREGWLRADIETVDGRTEKAVTLPPKTWRSKRDFIESFPHVKYVFQGTDRDVQDIMQLATRNIPKNMMKKGVHYIGFVDGYFVGPDFAISKDGIVENAPVEYVKKGSGSEFERHLKIHTTPDLKATLKHFCELILKVNRPEVTLTMLGWMFACFFKAQIHKIIRYFPIFSIFGTSGAGKTSLSLAFLRLFGLDRDFKLFNANSTWFATSTTLASTDCIPMVVDELKETIGKDLINTWLQRIRSAYMGETEVRGTKDQTTRSTTYRAPLATVGETSIIREQATAERTIKITPERSFIEQNKDAKSAFYALDNVVQTEALFPKIVQWCLLEGFSQTTTTWYATKERVAYMKLPIHANRVIDNYAVVLFGLTMFEKFCAWMGVDFTVKEEVRKEIVMKLVNENSNVGGRSRIALDSFLEEAANMAMKGILKKGENYCVDDGILYIHMGSSVPEYRKYCHETKSEGEIQGKTELANQARELEKVKQTYVIHASKQKRLGTEYSRKCLIINLKKADDMGLDVGGFGVSYGQEMQSWEKPPQEAEAPPAAPAAMDELALPPELMAPNEPQQTEMFGTGEEPPKKDENPDEGKSKGGSIFDED